VILKKSGRISERLSTSSWLSCTTCSNEQVSLHISIHPPFGYHEEVKNTIEILIKEALRGLDIQDTDFVVEHPADLKMGDYSTNVGIKRRTRAQEIFEYLDKNKTDDIERVEIAGPGFINFYLSKKFFLNSLKQIIDAGDNFGQNSNLEDKKFLVEHTQPNPFKEFHIGHMMNNIIGESVAGMIKANGANVKTVTYHGDVGLHVAKAIWGALKQSGDFTGAYAFGHKSYEDDENAKKEIIEINKKIYDKSDSKVNALYESGRQNSLDDFELMYKRLGSEFAGHFYESEAGEIGKKLVLENAGEVFEESEGAIIFKGEKFGLHTRVFLNSEKLPTYEAKEVGLAKIKKNKFVYDESITITANEQDAFFNVVEVAISQIFPELNGKLRHLSHGVLKLPSGKMSSRTGTIITAEDLIEDVKKIISDKGDIAQEEVAIGAIKYMILRQSIGNDIIFDLEKSVSTEGDSGVYLQYAYARTNSILEKADKSADTNIKIEENYEIEKLLYRFPEVVENAMDEFAPSHITTYLTQLAGSFNSLYAREQILSDKPESAYLIAVTKAFNTVMKNGLTILGIPTPERM